MTFEEFFKKTSGLTNEKEIRELLDSLSEKQIKCFFENVKEYYLSKQGKKMLLALEIEKILFNTPKKQMKWREFGELLNLYQRLIGERTYKETRFSIKIEEKTIQSINNLYNEKFEKSISNYFAFLEKFLSEGFGEGSDTPLTSILAVTLMSEDCKIGTITPGSENEKINNFIDRGFPFSLLLKTPLRKTLSSPISYENFF